MGRLDGARWDIHFSQLHLQKPLSLFAARAVCGVCAAYRAELPAPRTAAAAACRIRRIFSGNGRGVSAVVSRILSAEPRSHHAIRRFFHENADVSDHESIAFSENDSWPPLLFVFHAHARAAQCLPRRRRNPPIPAFFRKTRRASRKRPVRARVVFRSVRLYRHHRLSPDALLSADYPADVPACGARPRLSVGMRRPHFAAAKNLAGRLVDCRRLVRHAVGLRAAAAALSRLQSCAGRAVSAANHHGYVHRLFALNPADCGDAASVAARPLRPRVQSVRVATDINRHCANAGFDLRGFALVSALVSRAGIRHHEHGARHHEASGRRCVSRRPERAGRRV